MSALFEMRAITKEYRGVAAIKDVAFEVAAGEVHALLGENGAGKSTLVKIMAGAVQPTRGELRLDGAPIVFATPAKALACGIAMVYQETSLVPSMTVAQNIYLGEEKLLNRLRGIHIAAQQFLQSLNFSVDPGATVASLGAAQKQMVEIARAVRRKARIIIFDEPTASLTPEEKHHFVSLVARLKQDGVAVVFISHALEEALAIADRITILRDGELVDSDTTSAFDREKIIRAMVGRTLSSELYRHRAAGQSRAAGERVLTVQDLTMGSAVRNNSFSIYAGQITSMFGLVGSGRSETAKVIAGVLKRDFFHGGEIRFEGHPVRYKVPAPAVADGIVYVTEDRKLEGFFETMSIAENLYAALLARDFNANGMLVSMTEMQELADRWIKNLGIKAIDPSGRVVELSGGNQQKVVIGKALVQRPRLIILDEPTRGVDVGAIDEIHQMVHRLADDGMAVIVISSYLPEVMNLSDRILVCRQGRIVEEFTPGEATEELIMYAAVH
ncbi:MAG: sugar ABC transporter ATP-binding protein [Caldimonas sp.]